MVHFYRNVFSHVPADKLREAALMLVFRETYNTTWLIEIHGFISPPRSASRRQAGVSDDGQSGP